MELLTLANNSIFDCFRKKNVASLPEENVRQKLVHFMVEKLSFPKELISLEQNVIKSALDTSDTLSNKKRRCDIVVYAKGIHPEKELYPLLLIECKAQVVNEKTLEQVKGYNEKIKAFFIAIANSDQIQTYWFNANKHDYEMLPFLPSYPELVQAIQKNNRL